MADTRQRWTNAIVYNPVLSKQFFFGGGVNSVNYMHTC